MKMFGFWVLLFLVVVWTIFMFPTLSTSLTTSTSISVIGMNTDMTVPICEDVVEAKSSIEEHKGKNYDPITEKKVNNEGNLNLEDYHQIDPAPYSRATIKFGPIEHGTPLMPYIPKPTPPYHPIHGVSPSP